MERFEYHGRVWRYPEEFAAHMGMEALRLSLTGHSDVPVSDLILWLQSMSASDAHKAV